MAKMPRVRSRIIIFGKYFFIIGIIIAVMYFPAEAGLRGRLPCHRAMLPLLQHCSASAEGYCLCSLGYKLCKSFCRRAECLHGALASPPSSAISEHLFHLLKAVPGTLQSLCS